MIGADADFEATRRKLLGIAYRMLGSVPAAEDVVQEVWLRWARARGVENAEAWLVTVCTRLCVDELRSARHRRTDHVGPWLPDPFIEPQGPRAADDDDVSQALLLLLENLTPRERAAFLLREVFEADYSTVAATLGSTEAAARQLVRRALSAIGADRPRFEADPEAESRLFAAFSMASATGDVAALEALLASDVVAMSDSGGVVRNAGRRPVVGPSKVARLFVGLLRKAAPTVQYEPARINGQLGVLVWDAGVLISATCIEVRGGLIVAIRSQVDLRRLAELPISSALAKTDPLVLARTDPP